MENLMFTESITWTSFYLYLATLQDPTRADPCYNCGRRPSDTDLVGFHRHRECGKMMCFSCHHALMRQQDSWNVLKADLHCHKCNIRYSVPKAEVSFANSTSQMQAQAAATASTTGYQEIEVDGIAYPDGNTTEPYVVLKNNTFAKLSTKILENIYAVSQVLLSRPEATPPPQPIPAYVNAAVSQTSNGNTNTNNNGNWNGNNGNNNANGQPRTGGYQGRNYQSNWNNGDNNNGNNNQSPNTSRKRNNKNNGGNNNNNNGNNNSRNGSWNGNRRGRSI